MGSARLGTHRKVACGPRSWGVHCMPFKATNARIRSHAGASDLVSRMRKARYPPGGKRRANSPTLHVVGVLAERTRRPSHPAIDDWLNAPPARSLSATGHGSSEINLVKSDSGQALAVWVRTFPSELKANANFATFSPSGASTIRSRSCSPVVRNICWMSTLSFFASSRAALLLVGASLTARRP